MLESEAKTQTWLQVTDLVRLVNSALRDRFGRVAVVGEIDGFKAYSSGHWYFSLKDAGSCLAAVMWRDRAKKVSFMPKDGMKVRAIGNVSIYETQGKIQFYVEELVLDGDGEAQRKLEELKRRLKAEGLFDEGRKRKLPRFPTRVGLVTSLDGAVLRDILHVASRRGRVQFVLHPCQVQGETAPGQMCIAIQRLQDQVELIIIARGGGASVDLSAFNDEQLARAIFTSRVPVVSAVGHEVDFTIADFVADLRAPTPSAAAECVVPDFAVLEQDVDSLMQRVILSGRRAIEQGKQSLSHPLQRAYVATLRLVERKKQALAAVIQRLTELHPRARLLAEQAMLRHTTLLLHTQHKQKLALARRHFSALVAALDAMSPLRVLSRGYAVAFDERGHVVSQADHVSSGQTLMLRLHRGSVSCAVLQTRVEE